MATASYKFSDFVDLLLVRLYELDRDLGDQFVDLNAMLNELQGTVPASWVFDAAKVLQTRGLADCVFTFGGISAHITGEGRLYVEEGRGFTRKVQEDPAQYFNISVSGGNANIIAGSDSTRVTQTATIQQQTAPIFRVLDEMEQQLLADESLKSDDKLELRTYVELLRQQAKKPEPNRSLIASLLDSLNKVTSISANVATLIRFFNSSM